MTQDGSWSLPSPPTFVCVQAGEVVPVELAERVDVLDLLHPEDVEIDVLDARREELPLSLGLPPDELAEVGPGA